MIVAVGVLAAFLVLGAGAVIGMKLQRGSAPVLAEAVPDSGRTAASPKSEETSSAPAKLDIDVPFENVSCTGQYLVLLKSSAEPDRTSQEIEDAARNEPDAHYLRSDQSCEAIFSSNDAHPIYAAYLGPFESQSEACAARADSHLEQPEVARLSSDRASSRTLCICLDSADDLPRLDTDVETTLGSTAGDALHDLRTALKRLNYDLSGAAGTYDDDMASDVKRYQKNNHLTKDGWVGAETWGSLLAEDGICD